MFPSVRLTDKQLKLSADEIDLFLYYAVQKLMYYQKELNKLEVSNTILNQLLPNEVLKFNFLYCKIWSP